MTFFLFLVTILTKSLYCLIWVYGYPWNVLVTFSWNIFFILSFSAYVSLKLMWDFCRQRVMEFCIFIQPVYEFCLTNVIHLHLRQLLIKTHCCYFVNRFLTVWEIFCSFLLSFCLLWDVKSSSGMLGFLYLNLLCILLQVFLWS